MTTLEQVFLRIANEPQKDRDDTSIMEQKEVVSRKNYHSFISSSTDNGDESHFGNQIENGELDTFQSDNLNKLSTLLTNQNAREISFIEKFWLLFCIFGRESFRNYVSLFGKLLILCIFIAPFLLVGLYFESQRYQNTKPIPLSPFDYLESTLQKNTIRHWNPFGIANTPLTLVTDFDQENALIESFLVNQMEYNQIQ